MGDEQEKMEAEFMERFKSEEQQVQIVELEDERAEWRNRIAAEKTEHMEQMNDFADGADILEGWVITKVC